MLRYSYPLIILVLMLLFCGCIRRPFLADSMAGPIFMVLSARFLSTGWPLLIGHRLHEPAWRKLAEQLHLSYEPYGKKGDTGNKAARIIGATPRKRVVRYDMALTLSVNVPVQYKMHFRTKPQFNQAFKKQIEREMLPQSGYDQLDRRFVFYHKPEFVDRVLAATNLPERLPGSVRGNRPTDIDLHNQELRFQDRHGLYMGAESDINYLRRLIDVTCDLAEAIENVAT